MLTESIYKSCTLCPRECHADRTISTGFCGAGHELPRRQSRLTYVGRAMYQRYHTEAEPSFSPAAPCAVSSARTSSLSHENYGKDDLRFPPLRYFPGTSGKRRRKHQSRDRDPVRSRPSSVLWISQSRSFRSQLSSTAGDMKRPRRSGSSPTMSISGFRISNTWTAVSSKKYSAAPDYFEKASAAIKEMIRLTGGLPWNKKNPAMLDRGVVIRHMVLPGAKDDSIRLLALDQGEPSGTSVSHQHHEPVHAVLQELPNIRKSTAGSPPYEYNKGR